MQGIILNWIKDEQTEPADAHDNVWVTPNLRDCWVAHVCVGSIRQAIGAHQGLLTKGKLLQMCGTWFFWTGLTAHTTQEDGIPTGEDRLHTDEARVLYLETNTRRMAKVKYFNRVLSAEHSIMAFNFWGANPAFRIWQSNFLGQVKSSWHIALTTRWRKFPTKSIFYTLVL